MATNSQIKRIHTLKSILGLEDDLYRDMLFSFGVCTSKDLTFTEASVLLDILETKAVERNLWKKQPKKYEDMNRGDKMATPPQLRMIKGLLSFTFSSSSNIIYPCWISNILFNKSIINLKWNQGVNV